MVKSYINDKPAWMVDRDNSVIRVLSREEVEHMDEKTFQDMFRRHNIVVRDQFHPTLSFDEKGLKTLAGLNKLVTLHGEYLILLTIKVMS